MAWSENVEAVLSIGVSLFDIGINNWALNKSQSMRALDEFERLKIPVLGGDVYEVVDGTPESNYDNWYCDRNDKEVLGEFIARSISYAREYISNYSNPSGRETLFVLVAQ